MPEFLAPEWEAGMARPCRLSILCGMDSFSLGLINRHQVLVAYREYPYPSSGLEEAKGWLEEVQRDSLLTFSSDERTFQVMSPVFTFIPRRLYHENKVASYLAHLTDAVADAPLGTYTFTSWDMCMIYRVSPWQATLAESLFPGNIPLPAFAQVLPFLGRQSSEGVQVFARLGRENALLVVFRDGLFQFANTFICRQDTDFSYFIHLVCQQFQVNPLHETLYLWGELEEESELLASLRQEFCRIKFLEAQPIRRPESRTRIVQEWRVLEHLLEPPVT